jgi:hypothetical protein
MKSEKKLTSMENFIEKLMTAGVALVLLAVLLKVLFF